MRCSLPFFAICVTFRVLRLIILSSRMTDTDLVALTAKGDRDAFASLYERHWKAVYSYAWLLARSVAEAEDVTQECFLVLVRRAGSFDPSRAQLRTWLLAVARNQYLQKRRKQAREAALTEGGPASGSGLDGELMSLERAEAVQRALRALPEAQREALYLFEFEGLSLAESAVVLEIDANAVKARLYRGREQLKRLLSPLRPALSLKNEGNDE
jgi:RNA polymerase sigma-70 factor (ECF subfamily)